MVSFSYAFPGDWSPFKTRAHTDWLKAIAALGSEDDVIWSQFYKKANIELMSNEVKVDFIVPPTYVANIQHLAKDVTGLADILVKGPKCRYCSRRTDFRSSVCCKSCSDSNGTSHNQNCDVNHTREDEREAAKAKCLRLHTAPQVTVLVETYVASKEPLETLSPQCLAAVAASTKSNKAVLTRSVESVASSARFIFECYGDERVGCCICDVNAMPKQSWFHAASREHKHNLMIWNEASRKDRLNLIKLFASSSGS